MLGTQKKPNKIHVLFAYLLTKVILLGKQPDTLINLSEMTDPYKIAQMRIGTSMMTAIYFASPDLLPLFLFKTVKLSIKYGNTPGSIPNYTGYGAFLCGGIGDIKSGFEFGKLALRLSKKVNAKSFESRRQYLFNIFIRHWKQHILETLTPLGLGFQEGLETGDFESAACNAYYYSYYSFFAGVGLSTVEKKLSEYNQAIMGTKQKGWLYNNESLWKHIMKMMCYNQNATAVSGDVLGNKGMIKEYIKENNRSAIFGYYFFRLMNCYLFYKYDHAVESAEIAKKHLIAALSQITVPIFHFYDSLAQLALFSGTTRTNQKLILKKVTKNQKKMKKWAHHAPMNHFHKWQLVEAERARMLGKHEKAIGLYDQAIAGAKENQYIQEEALANELAAKFYLEKGETDTARKYMTEARYCYDHWGAKAKVGHLDKNYPELLADVLAKTLQASTNDKDRKPGHATTITTGNQLKSEQLDLTSVMKASQVISGEIQIEKLLSRMMQIIIENAGAEKGCLILKADGDFRIEGPRPYPSGKGSGASVHTPGRFFKRPGHHHSVCCPGPRKPSP